MDSKQKQKQVTPDEAMVQAGYRVMAQVALRILRKTKDEKRTA